MNQDELRLWNFFQLHQLQFIKTVTKDLYIQLNSNQELELAQYTGKNNQLFFFQELKPYHLVICSLENWKPITIWEKDELAPGRQLFQITFELQPYVPTRIYNRIKCPLSGQFVEIENGQIVEGAKLYLSPDTKSIGSPFRVVSIDNFLLGFE